MMTRKSKSTGRSRNALPLVRKIGALRRERAELEEEVVQLKAAVNIWAEVCRQTAAGGKQGETA